jgi:hypothetical protein
VIGGTSVSSKAAQGAKYESPRVTVLGSAVELTMGPIAGAVPDATLPLHTSR